MDMGHDVDVPGALPSGDGRRLVARRQYARVRTEQVDPPESRERHVHKALDLFPVRDVAAVALTAMLGQIEVGRDVARAVRVEVAEQQSVGSGEREAEGQSGADAIGGHYQNNNFPFGRE